MRRMSSTHPGALEAALDTIARSFPERKTPIDPDEMANRKAMNRLVQLVGRRALKSGMNICACFTCGAYSVGMDCPGETAYEHRDFVNPAWASNGDGIDWDGTFVPFVDCDVWIYYAEAQTLQPFQKSRLWYPLPQ